jgi:membrane fusion protein, multidrug efflux system
MSSNRSLGNMGIRAGALLLSLSVLAACKGEQQNMQPPPTEVAVQTISSASAPLDLTYTARTVGSREVEVRARVGGILLKRRYEEGSRVKEGETMFQIDPEPIRARLASARAEVAVAKARLEEARRQQDRILPLFDKNAVSQSRRDEVVSAFEVAQANVAAAEAAQRTAELDLEYSDVRAPISGLTSREVLSEGSLVSTDSSLLTRIVQIDPLYVEFSVPEAEAALLRNSIAPSSNSAPTVKLLLDDGSQYQDAAKLTFVDNAVDPDSGTVRVRAVLKNASAQLIPGQFVRAKVEGVTLANVVSVQRKAVMNGPQGRFVWLVAAGDKIEFRPVQVGRGFGNNVVVTQGLAPGDRVVVEGVMKVQPGAPVTAVPIDAAAQQAASAVPAVEERA